jgi:uncharacterized protein
MEFSGYASLFNKRDNDGDIVKPKAFLKSLKKRKVKDIRMLFHHDFKEPIGVWLDIHEDQKGLFVKGRLLTEIPKAHEIATLLRFGGLNGLSIGYRTMKSHNFLNRRELLEIDLFEISLVAFPMLQTAVVNKIYT